MDRWIADDVVNARWPHYTRANAAEVGPEPFSPLGWTLGMRDACRPGITDGWVELGILSDEERKYRPDGTASFGGWIYNNMSLARMVGVRMPGGDPELMERASFGHYDGVPPYEPHPEDSNAAQSQRMGEVLGWIMSGEGISDLSTAAAQSERLRADRPDLGSLTDAALVDHARSFFALIRTLWRMHMQASIGASIATGGVQAIVGGLGRAADSSRLFTAIGNIVSADSSVRLWSLGRIVAGSPPLMTEFNRGIDGIEDRIALLAPLNGVELFRSAFAELLRDHGHRGANEWDLASRSWDIDRRGPLSIIERLRFQDAARDPEAASSVAATARAALTDELLALLPDPATKGGLLATVNASAVFLASREQTKTSLIRCINEMRLAVRELGRRRVETGTIDRIDDVFMLLADELDDFTGDAAADRWRNLLLSRAAEHLRHAAVEPPFFIDGTKGVPPIEEWPQRRGDRHQTATSGDVLLGGPGAPGCVEGTARVVLDPGHADHLEPGDIMIVEMTDPSWTPLFLAVAGVVANVGAIISHAAIVCREVGVPCVVACEGATSRIADGSRIRIDGSTGTVEIL